jgi:hypothetical protein
VAKEVVKAPYWLAKPHTPTGYPAGNLGSYVMDDHLANHYESCRIFLGSAIRHQILDAAVSGLCRI